MAAEAPGRSTYIQNLKLMCITWLINWLSRLINWLETGSSSRCGVASEISLHPSSAPRRIRLALRTSIDFRGHSLDYDTLPHAGITAGFDFDATPPDLNDFTTDELLDWLNTDVGAGSIVQATLIQDSRNEDNIELEPEYNTNYNVVERNTDITIQHVSQDELHIANEVYEEKDNSVPQDTVCISSSTTPIVADNQRTSKISISLEVLQRHFKMSLVDAAKSLDVSVSTLKRICRRNGIERWPNRRKRKTINNELSPNPKNVDKLVQIDNKDQTNKSTRSIIVSHCEEVSNRDVTIKAAYGDDIVKFSFSVSLGLGDLKEKVCKRLDLDIPIKLKYNDDVGDLVFVGCDDTLHEIFGNRQNTTFDFLVFPVTR